MKLITLNIEGDKHLERVLPFLSHEKPDILCLQEVFSDTAKQIASLGYSYEILPMTRKIHNGEEHVVGVAIFVAHNIPTTYHTQYYDSLPDDIHLYDAVRFKETVRSGVIFARCEFQGTQYVIGTTHFTWVERGEEPSIEQTQNMKTLLDYITKEPPHVLCGDFNIPRGYNALYDLLRLSYVDAVPQHYTSSLDRTLHRLGANSDKRKMFDSFMVDYIFSQPPYTVSDVRLEFDISDHAAVIGTVSR